MVKPSLSSLMNKENINRYTLVVATAKCARKITDEYVAQREYIEKSSGKDLERAGAVINDRYRDEKAVQNAIEELYYGDYTLKNETLPYGQGFEKTEDHASEADEEDRDVSAEASAAEENA